MYLKPERAVFVIFLIHFVTVSGVTHYCEQGNTVRIANENNGIIKTVVSGKNFYDNNLDCDWIIDGGINNQIQLTVTGIDLQHSPDYTSCGGYDNLAIKDGDSSSAKEITAICGEKNPYEVISSGRYLYLKFYSNDKNFYNHAGVTLTFTVFDKSGCPPDWVSFNSSNQCYRIRKQPPTGFNWFSAYHSCILSQANLAIIENQLLFIDLQSYGVSQAVSTAWVGLTDIGVEGTLKWLNDEQVGSWIRTEGNIDDDDCGIFDFTAQKFWIKDCKNSDHFLICQRPNGGGTLVTYPLPEEQEKTAEPEKFNIRIILIIVGILLVIVVIAIIIGYKIRRKNQYKRAQQPVELDPVELEAGTSSNIDRNRGIGFEDDLHHKTPLPEGSIHPTAPPPYEHVVRGYT